MKFRNTIIRLAVFLGSYAMNAQFEEKENPLLKLNNPQQIIQIVSIDYDGDTDIDIIVNRKRTSRAKSKLTTIQPILYENKTIDNN